MSTYDATHDAMTNSVIEIEKYLIEQADKVEEDNVAQKVIVTSTINNIINKGKSLELLEAEYALNSYELFADTPKIPFKQFEADSIKLRSNFNRIIKDDVSVLVNDYFKAFGKVDVDVKDAYQVVRDWKKKTNINPVTLTHKMSNGTPMRLDHYMRMVARSEQNIQHLKYIDEYTQKYDEPFYQVNERIIETSREGSIRIAGQIISKDSTRLIFTDLYGNKHRAIFEGNTDIGQAGGAFGVNSIRQAFVLSDGYSDADVTELERTEETPNEILTRYQATFRDEMEGKI